MDCSFSDYLDLDSTEVFRQELEDAFDLMKLDKHFAKEEYIFELLEQKYADEYSRNLEAAYEEFKCHGFKG